MKKENMNSLDGMNYQEYYSVSPLEVRKTVRHHGGSKRRLVLLIILLICTLSLLGSATYAWFTANRRVRVGDLQINVNVANGIQIASDATTWKQAITLDDLYKAAGLPLEATRSSDSEDAGAINQFPGYLHNISSIGNISLYHRDNAKNNNNRLELFTGKASSVCDVPDPVTPGLTKPVGISSDGSSDGYAGDYYDANGNGKQDSDEKSYSLEDCVIGEYCVDTDEDGIPECDGDTHSITTGLVNSAPYTGEDTTSCKGTGEGGCANTVDVIAFDLYLKLDEASNIKLAEGSSVTRTGKDNLGLENTIRVAFVTLGTQPADFYYAEDKEIDTNGKGKTCAATGDPDCIDITSTEDFGLANKDYNTTFGGYTGKFGARAMNAFGSITIWEPNHTQHTKAALENAEKNYKLTNITDDLKTDGIYASMGNRAEGYLPLPLAKANHTTTPQKFAPQQEVTDVTSANEEFDSTKTNAPYKNKIGYKKTAGKIEADGAQILFAAPKGVTKLRVYIWVEGNDIDTENNATASTVNVSLLFTSAVADGDPTPSYTAGSGLNEYEKYDPNNSIDPIATGSKTWRTTPTLDSKIKTPTGPTK